MGLQRRLVSQSVLQSGGITPLRQDSQIAALRTKSMGQVNVEQRNGKKVFRFHSSDHHSPDTSALALGLRSGKASFPFPWP